MGNGKGKMEGGREKRLGTPRRERPNRATPYGRTGKASRAGAGWHGALPWLRWW